MSWTIEDCDYSCHSFFFDSLNYTWDTLPYGTWDSITDSRWGDIGKTGILPYEAVGNSTGKIFKANDTHNNNGVAIEGFIETGDLFYVDEKTGIRYNMIVNEVIPICKPQDSVTAIMVQVGVRESLHKDIEWSQPQAFTIGVSRHVNFRKMGKYCRLRFYSDTTDSPWIIEGWQMRFSIGGSR